MRSWLAVSIVVAALTGCEKQSVEAAPKADAASTKEALFVRMDELTQRRAGVVAEPIVSARMPERIRVSARLTNDEDHTWRVGSIAEGRIMSVHANPGDSVQADQILARMHSHQIHESRADYQRSVADLARKRTLVDYSTRLRDRAKRLYAIKAGSLEQLEKAESEVKNAEAEEAIAKTEVERARSHITEVLGLPIEEIQGEPKGEDDDLIPVRSPAAGVVLTRGVTPGTVVTPATDQFLISDLSRLWAIAEVPQEQLASLRVGMAARVFVQAYGGEAFVGRIGKIGDVLDAATRTVKVRIELGNARGRLKPEMYADAEIDTGRSEPVLTLVPEAIQEIRGHSSVFVQVANDRFEVRPVQLGRTFDNAVELSGPIAPGERIVIKAAFVLKSEYLKGSLAAE